MQPESAGTEVWLSEAGPDEAHQPVPEAGVSGEPDQGDLLFLQPELLDLGLVISRNVAIGVAELVNDSARDVEIERIHSSCGCTAMMPASRLVPAGSTLQIPVSFAAGAHPGAVSKSVSVALTGHASPLRLRVQAEVVTSAQLPCNFRMLTGSDPGRIWVDRADGATFALECIYPETLSALCLGSAEHDGRPTMRVECVLTAQAWEQAGSPDMLYLLVSHGEDSHLDLLSVPLLLEVVEPHSPRRPEPSTADEPRTQSTAPRLQTRDYSARARPRRVSLGTVAPGSAVEFEVTVSGNLPDQLPAPTLACASRRGKVELVESTRIDSTSMRCVLKFTAHQGETGYVSSSLVLDFGSLAVLTTLHGEVK